VKAWLESKGLAVRWVSPSRTFIGFGGEAQTVGRAFGTEVHVYRVNGKERVSVASDPMIPSVLAPVVKAIHGLYAIDERPAHVMGAAQTSAPDFTISDGSHFIVPADFQTIYDGVVSYSGYGQTIGIVGRSRTNPQELSDPN
jgi:subtilase family serine protease